MLLTKILEQSAQAFSDYPALTMRMGYRTTTLTYREVYQRAQKIAVFLQQHGLKKGDYIVLLAPNSPYWVCLFWACMLTGIVIVPVTMQSTLDMVKRFAQHTEAKLFIKHRFCHFDISGLTTYNIELIDELIDSCDLALLQRPILEPDDVMQILYTSGTTGDPKGTMLSHKNIASNVASTINLFPMKGTNERLLSILPLSHIYEQTFGLLVPFSLGAHIIYMHSPAAIRDLLQQYRVTKMLAVPEFLKLFMSKIEAGAEEKGRMKMLERMRKLTCYLKFFWMRRVLFRSVLKQFGGKLDMIASGGAPLDPLLEGKWEDFGVLVLQGYGLTETSPLVTTNTPYAKRLGSVGKVVPGVNVKLADDGEILVKGPSVFTGYFKVPEKTKEAFTDDGWFKTGDIGFFDADGFMFLKGRKKYMILGPGGQNVYPDDIEQELNEMPGVKDACVIGLEEAGGHVQIHAALLLHEGAGDPAKIIATVNERLASYQRIHGWTVWPDADFPRSATRKVKKHEVTKIIQDQRSVHIKSNGLVKTQLMKLLAHLSGKDLEDIIPETNIIQDLSLDSLALVEMVMRIEEIYAVTIDETKISAQTTVTDVEVLIKQAGVKTKPVQPKRWLRSWWIKPIRFLGQHLLFLVTHLWVRYEIKGLENLQDLKQPVVFMPNHTSYFDAIAFAKALPAPFRKNISFAAARDVLFEEFKSFALVAEVLFNAFSFPRKEQENIKQGLDMMGRLLDDGCNVVMFPEGHISRTGELQEFKKGAGLVAVEMGVPVVPVFIQGANDIFPYGVLKPRKYGTIMITFGKPIKVSKAMNYDEATVLIHDIFQLFKLK